MRRTVLIALALLSACGPGVDEVPEDMLAVENPDSQATLKRLFAEGYVRAATQADVDAYNRAATKAQPAGRPPYLDPWLRAPIALVLLKPFKFTRDMRELTIRHIIVPEGVESRDWDPKFAFYFVADGHCTLVGGQCPGAPKYDADKIAREKYNREQREKEQAISDYERDEGNWGDTGKKAEPPRDTSPIERLTE